MRSPLARNKSRRGLCELRREVYHVHQRAPWERTIFHLMNSHTRTCWKALLGMLLEHMHSLTHTHTHSHTHTHTHSHTDESEHFCRISISNKCKMISVHSTPLPFLLQGCSVVTTSLIFWLFGIIIIFEYSAVLVALYNVIL